MNYMQKVYDHWQIAFRKLYIFLSMQGPCTGPMFAHLQKPQPEGLKTRVGVLLHSLRAVLTPTNISHPLLQQPSLYPSSSPPDPGVLWWVF